MSTGTHNEPRVRSGNRSLLGPILLTFAILVAIGAIVLVILGAVDWTQDEDDDEIDVGVTLNDVAADPGAYTGTVVTINGEVDRVVNPQAVVIGGEGFYGGAEILVVDDEEISLPEGLEREVPSVEENDLVQVTGRVRMLSAEREDEFPDEFDFLFSGDAYTQFVGQPVILAQTINLTPRVNPADDEEGSVIPVVHALSAGMEITVRGNPG